VYKKSSENRNDIDLNEVGPRFDIKISMQRQLILNGDIKKIKIVSLLKYKTLKS
jgi:hypothetical protein